MCLRTNGGAAVSLQRGLHFLDLKTGEVELIHDPEHTQKRLNDAR
jgi:L-arabinonolactonase